ncbi:MAG: MarR family transcriptional regulator [Paenibacillaceae bacterium]|jgi:DNA-binding MarR family transcriptional regulator|nr:MarR family transcriptional regulator [Paenibacillaceae bacterium]
METQKLDSLITRYGEVYLFATRKISSMITEHVMKDITIEQYFAVRYLKKHGRCSASQLAEVCGVNRSAVTAMVDRLVAKGYVSRIRDDEDRRMVYLDITEAGDQVYLRGEERLRQLVESYLQELEESEIEAFVSIYEKIATIISRNGGM